MPEIDPLIPLARSLASALQPIPATLSPRLVPLRDARLPRTPAAILFDVYGTLLVSASGEIGNRARPAVIRARADAFQRALSVATGASCDATVATRVVEALDASIRDEHRMLHAAGTPHPEIDIRRTWRSALEAAGIRMTASRLESHAEIDPLLPLAVAYEMITNPTWPMPGAADALATIDRDRMPIGIVSNAQFFTPIVIEALLGSDASGLGIDVELCAWSFEHRFAKPDPRLFDRPLALLRSRGIDSARVVYVGNDVRNDIWCAQARGCMTVLFAGDARSLRLREPEYAAVAPDSVIESLGALRNVVRLDEGEQ